MPAGCWLPVSGKRTVRNQLSRTLIEKVVCNLSEIFERMGVLPALPVRNFTMPACESKYFGTLEHTGDTVITLPSGLLGFGAETSFVLVQRPEEFPLVYMQSRLTKELCFLTLPVLTIDPRYRLELSPDDATVLETLVYPRIGSEVLCLVLITVHAAGPTANLLAPVVVNLQTRQGAQCINAAPGYSHQHALTTPSSEGAAA
jgi:flagellar assembly factor FliW